MAAERFAQIRAVRHFAAEEREKARYGCVLVCVTGGSAFDCYVLNAPTRSTHVCTSVLWAHSRIIDDSMVLARRLAKSEGSYVAAIYSVSNFALIGVLFMGAGREGEIERVDSNLLRPSGPICL